MLKIEYISIDKLKPHPSNPRTIKNDDFDRLCRSIHDNPEFFEARPVIYNKKMQVFAGNQRLKAAKELGLEKIPAVLMDISEEKEQELMIRDNISNGDWDIIELANFKVEDLATFGMEQQIMDEINDYVNGTDFLPDEQENQGKLSEGRLVVCPDCGSSFELKS